MRHHFPNLEVEILVELTIPLDDLSYLCTVKSPFHALLASLCVLSGVLSGSLKMIV